MVAATQGIKMPAEYSVPSNFAFDRGRGESEVLKGCELPTSAAAANEMTKSARSPSETGDLGTKASSRHLAKKPSEKSAAEQAVCDMDVPEHIVRMTVQNHILETGKPFANVQDLYLASQEIAASPERQATLCKKIFLWERPQQMVEEDGGEMSKPHMRDSVARTDEAEESAETPETSTINTAERHLEECPPTATELKLREKVRELTKENLKLERRKKCRVCRKVELATSGITFLPCGHFITCEDCAENCEDCPACGKNIMGTVRTFLC